MKTQELIDYIYENFILSGTSRTLVRNIIEWVSMQSMDKEDTISSLLSLLDGIGIEEEEIENFITL